MATRPFVSTGQASRLPPGYVSYNSSEGGIASQTQVGKQGQQHSFYGHDQISPARPLPSLQDVLNLHSQTMTNSQPASLLQDHSYSHLQPTAKVPQTRPTWLYARQISNSSYHCSQHYGSNAIQSGQRHNNPSMSIPMTDCDDTYVDPGDPQYQSHRIKPDSRADARDTPARQPSSTYLRVCDSTTGSSSRPTLDGINVQLSKGNGHDQPIRISFPNPRNVRASGYVGIQHDPELGTFHVYEDGNCIPMMIDGEPVHPLWGLTKANKARKRLAQACLRCRERKIKCIPTAKSCSQCEKSNYPHCRIAERSTIYSGTTDQLSLASSETVRVTPQARELEDPGSTTNSFSELQSGKGSGDSKRRPQFSRHGYDQDFMSTTAAPAASQDSKTFVNGAPSAQMYTIAHLLDGYFDDVNDSIYRIFPRHQFMAWFAVSSVRLASEMTVLQSMAAVASVFAGPDYVETGEMLANEAMKACTITLGQFDLGIVHVRLLLSLYNLARGNVGAAQDYCGLAIRAISVLHYDTEAGCIASFKRTGSVVDYGMGDAQLEECRRRTFWSAYLVERCINFDEQISLLINPTDIHLRLPCAEASYAHGSPSGADFFDGGISGEPIAMTVSWSQVSPMVCLIQIGTLWGHVMSLIARSGQVGLSGGALQGTYLKLQADLLRWSLRLPEHFTYSEQNLDRGIEEGHASTIMLSHALQHFALMRMNHHMENLKKLECIPSGAHTSHENACRLLSMVCTSRYSRYHKVSGDRGRSQPLLIASPCAGHMISLALKSVSHTGPKESCARTLELSHDGLTYLRELRLVWRPALTQSQEAEHQSLCLKY